MLKEGERAPDFSLSGVDEKGEEREYGMKEFRGRRVVLYFYPKDNTPGCTQEACDFRDQMNQARRCRGRGPRRQPGQCCLPRTVSGETGTQLPPPE